MSFTFLVLTSFYPAATHALQYSASLAATLNARLVLLHVKRASLFDPYVFAGEQWRQAELRDEAPTAEALEQLVAQLPVPATIEMNTDLLPHVMAELLTRYQPALFVLGRPAPHHQSEDVLTGTALDLLRTGNYPVLVIPLDSPATGLPQNVLLAADEEEFRLEPATASVTRFLQQMQAPLTVAHITPLEDDDACARALQAVRASGLLIGLPEPTLRGFSADDTAEGIREAVQATQAELVVVVTRQRSYLGELFHQSVTARLLRHCPVPVLLVPAVDVPAPEPAAPGTTAADFEGGIIY